MLDLFKNRMTNPLLINLECIFKVFIILQLLLNILNSSIEVESLQPL